MYILNYSISQIRVLKLHGDKRFKVFLTSKMERFINLENEHNVHQGHFCLFNTFILSIFSFFLANNLTFTTWFY